MPAELPGLSRRVFPVAFVDHLILECTPAVPVAVGTSLLSDLVQSDPETVLLLPVPPLRWSHHLLQRSHRFGVLLPMPATECQAGRYGHIAHGTDGSCSSWPPSIARAGVLVFCLVMGLAFRHASTLTSSLSWLK